MAKQSTQSIRRTYSSRRKEREQREKEAAAEKEKYSHDSTKPITFPFRKPRIGSQYQCKVSKRQQKQLESKRFQYESDRPPPKSMSKIYTHVTNQEVKKKEVSLTDFTDNNAGEGASDSAAYEQRAHSRYGYESRRGGHLVHRKQQEDFASFIQPLFVPLGCRQQQQQHRCYQNQHQKQQSIKQQHGKTRRLQNFDHDNDSGIHLWMDHLLEWCDGQQRKQKEHKQQHSIPFKELPQTSSSVTNTSKRGRKRKRKYAQGFPQEQEKSEQIEKLDWSKYFEAIHKYENNKIKKKRKPSPILHASKASTTIISWEYIEPAMEYLWTRHEGNVKAAKIETLVELSGGKAESYHIQSQQRMQELLHSSPKLKSENRPPPSARALAHASKRSTSPSYRQQEKKRKKGIDDDWRTQFRRTKLTMQGDYRTTCPDTNPYPVVINNKEFSAYKDLTDISSSCDRNEIGYQRVWRLVMSCAQFLEQQLSSHIDEVSANDGIKPFPLNNTTLHSFLNRVAMLPAPAKVFSSLEEVCFVEDITTCIENLCGYNERAQKVQSQIFDFLHKSNHQDTISTEQRNNGNADGTGVDWDIMRKSLFLDGNTNSMNAMTSVLVGNSGEKLSLGIAAIDCPIVIYEKNELVRQYQIHVEWQLRLDDFKEDKLIWRPLESLEELSCEGRAHTFYSKSYIQLTKRIEKAQQLRQRIIDWQEQSNGSVLCDESKAKATEARSKKEKTTRKKGTVKYITAMIRDANRLKLSFAEVTNLLNFHKELESWTDRANIAIRSRISLQEVKSLITKAQTFEKAVDLSEYLEKLRSRVALAENWMLRLQEVVPYSSFTNTTVDYNTYMLLWMKEMRRSLEDYYVILHELASEANRIPIEIDCVKLLQIELDARAWTIRTQKWLPLPNNRVLLDEAGNNTSDQNKRCTKGKIDDLRGHLRKASLIRERLSLPSDDTIKTSWVLDGETELDAIVDSADEWFFKYKEFMEGDNRRNGASRKCLSLQKLRQIVEEADSIHVQIGASASKMTRILTQAESWYGTYRHIIQRCCTVSDHKESTSDTENLVVELSDISSAVEAASADVSLDLDEAMELKRVIANIKDWSDRVEPILASLPVGGKRVSQRQSKGFRGRPRKMGMKITLDGISKLMEEAATLPVSTIKYVQRLESQLASIQKWKTKAMNDLSNIAIGFDKMLNAIDDTHGVASEYSLLCRSTTSVKQSAASSSITASTNEEVDNKTTTSLSLSSSSSQALNNLAEGSNGVFREEKKVSEDGSSNCETISTCGSELDVSTLTTMLPSFFGGSQAQSNNNIAMLIKNFRRESKLNGITTAEGDLAQSLEIVSKWCLRSLRYLDNPKDIFDKRHFTAFDRFVAEGNKLVRKVSVNGLNKNTIGSSKKEQKVKYSRRTKDSSKSMKDSKKDTQIVVKEEGEEKDCLTRSATVDKLNASWGAVIIDQLKRLDVLFDERKKFISLCDYAEELLFLESRKPPTIEKIKDLDNQIRKFPPLNVGMVSRVRTYCSKVYRWIETAKQILESDKKLTLLEGKNLLETGEKLKFSSPEIKSLRISVRTSKSWEKKVNKLKLDQGVIPVGEVKQLIEEHNSFLVLQPELLVKLKQSIKSYCICRGPYSGFMIGCDSCNEWYHGSCIGVTESKAERFDTYVCVKCNIVRVFKTSASNIVVIVRKWTCKKDMKKARQVDAQKHQRKVRKETKDIEKLQAEIKSLLSKLDNDAAARLGVNGSSSSQPNEVDPEISVLETLMAGDSINDEVKLKIEKITDSIRQCKERQDILKQTLILNTEQHKLEESYSALIRKWCLRARCLVLVPSTKDLAKKSRPLDDGSLSSAMLSLIQSAENLGIKNFSDVDLVINYFHCLCWSLHTMNIFRRKPSLVEVESILAKANTLRLPDEKAYRMLKFMVHRTTTWRGKVAKALTPIPGESKPLNLDMLKVLAVGIEDVPLRLPEESMLMEVIEDKGARYCFCGGPSDGRYMLTCDKCERWFHGLCVGVVTILDEWICPSCSGNSSFEANKIIGADFTNVFIPSRPLENGRHTGSGTVTPEQDMNPSALDPRVSWPPYGLFGSKSATAVLGEECSSIPDELSDINNRKIIVKKSPKTGKGRAKNIKTAKPIQIGNVTPLFSPPKNVINPSPAFQYCSHIKNVNAAFEDSKKNAGSIGLSLVDATRCNDGIVLSENIILPVNAVAAKESLRVEYIPPNMIGSFPVVPSVTHYLPKNGISIEANSMLPIQLHPGCTAHLPIQEQFIDER